MKKLTGCLCLAFGIYVRALEKTDAFAKLHEQMDGVELADSITIDGHKLLNVVCLELP